MLEIPRKQRETTVFTTNFFHSRIRLHLSISFFSAKCNLNRGNLIGPRTVQIHYTVYDLHWKLCQKISQKLKFALLKIVRIDKIFINPSSRTNVVNLQLLKIYNQYSFTDS